MAREKNNQPKLLVLFHGKPKAQVPIQGGLTTLFSHLKQWKLIC